jgi:2-methylcitrate dehydratase PrpD
VKEWSAAPLDACEGRYFIRDTKFKNHAACALTHGSIENMLNVIARHGVTPNAIAHVDLQVPTSSMGVCNIDEPQTGLEAKFSLRATAAMVVLGDATGDIGAYTIERVMRPDMVALRARIGVTPRDNLDGGNAVAVVTLHDGREITEAIDAYAPETDLAGQRERLIRKFHALLSPLIGDERVATLQDAVFKLDDARSVGPLIAMTGQIIR